MKALQLVATRAPLEWHEVPRPTPAPDEVLVRVSGCGVCHTDIGFWLDGVPTRHALPLTLGHEISGTVIETGAQVRPWLGREVIVPSVIPCGDCELCRNGRGNICRAQKMPGNDMDGGFAEFVAVPALGLCAIGTHAGYELAELSVIADAVTTPYQAIVRSALEPGELAIVVGTGGVGTYAVQIAAAFGARVIAIDVDDTRLEPLAGRGADLAINSAQTDFKSLRRRVHAMAREWRIAEHGWKIFECSGTAGGQETAFGLLTHAATLAVVGFTLDKVALRLSNAMAFDATIFGNWGCRPELYPAALALVLDGKVNLKPHIERFPLRDGPEVLERVARHQFSRRAILEPPPLPSPVSKPRLEPATRRVTC
ncbi:MAG: 6-hydroxycyclohex-1-ene-1-carbonyl-CoA dehydrogenase [Candidatus Eiseniibacteriota bacterium]